MNDPHHTHGGHYAPAQWDRTSQPQAYPQHYPTPAYGAPAHQSAPQAAQQQQYAYGHPLSSVQAVSSHQSYTVPSARAPTYPSSSPVQGYAVPGQHSGYPPSTGADSVANSARHQSSHSRSYSVPQPAFASTYAYDDRAPTHQADMAMSVSDQQFPASPQRPFACDMCPLSFSRQHDLKRHRETHSGEKPFLCNGGCGKTFTRKDALKRHQLVKRCGTDSVN
ncbi:unnamed protein product [Peniophora sp. CBMAI 1063]|nr:unnamed protein product [Peniophora sp. CBMAI 1063]